MTHRPALTPPLSRKREREQQVRLSFVPFSRLRERAGVRAASDAP
jgi:hypothetical protein